MRRNKGKQLNKGRKRRKRVEEEENEEEEASTAQGRPTCRPIDILDPTLVQQIGGVRAELP